jgi:hypothetical protein
VARRLSDRLRATAETRFEADWERQRRTAADILQRLQHQEGVILADQVGMGKTYVALAVAVSEILSTRQLGQVVIFVPPAVADKWVREWKKFSDTLLEPGTGICCVDHPIRSGEDFLKALDDPPSRRNHLVVVTHTALTSTLKDSFVQLALLHYATRNVRGAADLRKRIAKWSDGRRGVIPVSRFTPERVGALLETPPSKWRETWLNLTHEELPDDPVPTALDGAAQHMYLNDLRAVIEALPVRRSADIKTRLQRARNELAASTQAVWKWVLSSTDLDLPLLIVDEAHRLKNGYTQISKLFARRSEDPKDGAFDGAFRRMLFLTATPFELGHTELVNVLRRMGAVGEPVRPPLDERLEALQNVLTTAQASALSFDAVWARLEPGDVAAFDTWSPEGGDAPDSLGAAAREAWVHANLAVTARHEMHEALRPWVIRHERPHRRDYLPGAAITGNGTSGGLGIPDVAALPFLLAARAQSVALDAKGPARPLFAYGIASSYEAFGRLGSGADDDGRDSDTEREDRDDDDPSAFTHSVDGDAVRWYRREIDRVLADADVRESHPKVGATIDKAAALWCLGEKCLTFSWFIRTGKAIEDALVKRIDAIIAERAEVALRRPEPKEMLERISDRLFRSDSSSYSRIRARLTEALKEPAGGHDDVLELVVDASIRHLRTPGYLVRYSPLNPNITDEDIWVGIQGDNPSNVVLLDRWRLFAERLASARGQIEVVDPTDEHDSEFARLSTALLGARADDESSSGRGASLQPVRRAHGGTERHLRERLIALFNTPFAPELLVASSVMGEGIDLHQECRFVIHHDLDWNPSVLEQRTGRLDRIGALAERENKNIEVYEPYLAGTHDEKMYRVVKDRAQWFDVVMGRASGSDEHRTDAEERRLPLHDRIREALTMDLRSP